MVNLFNYTDREVSDTIEGRQVVIRPYGSVQVSETLADAMMDRHKGKVGTTAQPRYSDQAFKDAANLNKSSLTEFAHDLMRGKTPDPAAYGKAAENSANQNEQTGEEGVQQTG